MPLQRGTQLGPYRIATLIGSGGMGEVYRARDTRLQREVAIKVLPESLANDQDRLRRFEQEARSVAVLNHPNILAIYDFGQQDGVPYLVTELLEGESLRSVLQQGSLSDRKRLEHAAQIAQGLAAAHERGIVHRDLKPENVFITRSGRVKILDFGLAKLVQPEVLASDQPGATATSTGLVTSPGIAVGTPAYMSPEQLCGLPVDHRSDIFSFGLVLCETFSGRHPFQRPTSVETVNAILTADPFGEGSTGDSLPAGVRLIASHCLEKDPQQRFQSAHDLAFNLAALANGSPSLTTAIVSTPSPLSGWWPRLRLAGEVILLLWIAAAAFLGGRPAIPTTTVTAAISPPPGEGFWANHTQPAAISPDGKFLAIVSMQGGERQLWLRRMDSPTAQLISGTAGANNPFWSPDSRFVGFFTSDHLKKLDASGGTITDLCPLTSMGLGGTWSTQGVIVFAVLGSALKQVPENGGVPASIPGVDLSQNALSHLWPEFLPDGQHFLFVEWAYPRSAQHENGVWAASLNGEKPRRIPFKATNVQYASGHLLFSEEGGLFAQQFDHDRLELSGTPVLLARGIQYDSFVHCAGFTVSDTGILVYAPEGTGVDSELTWVDRGGRSLGVLGAPAEFMGPAISPDATRVAVDVKYAKGERIWIYDVTRGTRIALSTSGIPNYPTWSPDGKSIAYRVLDGKVTQLMVRAADGSGEERQIGPDSTEVLQTADWSRDGRYLLVERWPAWTPGARKVVQAWPVAGLSEAAFTIENALGPAVSRDGHWLAYYDENDEQLYVTSFPRPGGRTAIAAGGYDPRWRADGSELYYVGKDRMLMAAQIRETATEFQVTSSQPLFRLPLPDGVGFYDVTADGQRFLINTRTHLEQSAPLTLITDWLAQFRVKRDPHGRED